MASSLPDITPVLPVPDMMALLMSQLQPVLGGFNRSLEHLSKQMEGLAQDVEELKSSKLRGEQKEGSEEDKLEKVFQQIGKAHRQMEDQCRNMENMLHSQHVQFHQNLSRFKLNVDLKLKHHQKLLQVRYLLQILICICIISLNQTIIPKGFTKNKSLIQGQSADHEHNIN